MELNSSDLKNLEHDYIEVGKQLIIDNTELQNVCTNLAIYKSLWNCFVNYTGVTYPADLPISGNVIVKTITINTSEAVSVSFGSGFFTLNLPAGVYNIKDLDIPLSLGTGSITFTSTVSGTVSAIISGITANGI